MLGQPAIIADLLSLTPQEYRLPLIVTMTVAATRMHRALVAFAIPDVCAILHIASPAHCDQCRFSAPGDFRLSGLKFAARSRQIRGKPVTPNLSDGDTHMHCPAAASGTTDERSYVDHGLSNVGHQWSTCAYGTDSELIRR